MAVARRILDGAAEPSYLTGGGLLGWLTTVDHKRIAVLYGLTALVFFLVGGVEALLLRVQLARPDNTFLAAGTYNELFTMHGTTMIFLVVMPLELGLFTNFAVPLLIGARDVARTSATVTNMVHTNIGMRMNVMPGARMLTIVTPKLIPLIKVEVPSIRSPTTQKSRFVPGEKYRSVRFA